MMDSSIQYTLFIFLAPTLTLVTLGWLLYMRRAYPAPETRILTWAMLTIAGWLMFNTFELIATTERWTIIWSKISYGFIAFTPPAWIAFALQYIGRSKWTVPPRLFLLLIIPSLTTLFAWTNGGWIHEGHRWLWRAYNFTPVNNMLALNVEYGPWFWVHISFSYLCVFLGAFWIVRQYFQSFQLYQRQSVWLIVGALIPLLANAIYVFSLFPALKKDYTPISFALAYIAFALSIFRYRLFDLRPIARDAVIDSMSDAMLALDSQGRVIDINPAAQTIINQSANAVIGRPFQDVLSPWYDLLEQYQNQNQVEAEITVEVNGRQHHYDLRVSPLTNQRERLTGWLIVLRDITARKRAEAALRQYTRELEARNEELDAFAHTVAHDLKNPLTVLTGYADLLEKRRPNMTSEKVNLSINVIARSGERMARIIDELLLLSSVRKQEEVDIERLDTKTIIFEAMARLELQSEETQAQIVVPEQWPTALGYTPWVEEVWTNYISNALKYGGMPPHIELGATEQKGEGTNGSQRRMVRFWVRDNGPGIPPEKQPSLFTLYTRLDTRHVEGHGLGLSIVKRIVHKLGGDVGVESQIGEGSLFWFTLPAK